MNLLYLTFVNTSRNESSGVMKKVKGQVNAFNKHFNCYYTFIKSDFMIIKDSKETIVKEIAKDQHFINILAKRKSYYKILINFILEKKISCVYIRYNLSDPFFLQFLKECKELNLLVYLEIPTYPYVEEISSKLTKFVDLKYSNKVGKFSNFVCTFSEHEIIFGVPTIKLRNGIDVNQIKVKESNYNSQEINLIGIANVNSWHGYDRVIKGIYNYYRSIPNQLLNFHIVGDGNELPNLKELTKNLSLEKYIIFHSAKVGKELNEVVNDCQLGVGSLANHRKGLSKDSALKNREYCARGIPFIIASKDDDFEEDFKYVCRVSQDEEPIDIESIIKYYNSIQEYDAINEMRNFALNNLTWEHKMMPVIKSIKESNNF